MDTNEPLEPLTIDVRSPGERLAVTIVDQRFDIAAVLWMLSTLTLVGCLIYSALHLANGVAFSDSWSKVSALAQTGGPVIAVSCVVGIALAMSFETSAARVALWLAAAGGAWVLVAGILQVASTAHQSGDVPFVFGRANRAIGVLQGIAFAGLGLVVAFVAWRLARRHAGVRGIS